MRASDIVRIAEHSLSRFGGSAPHSSVSGPDGSASGSRSPQHGQELIPAPGLLFDVVPEWSCRKRSMDIPSAPLRRVLAGREQDSHGAFNVWNALMRIARDAAWKMSAFHVAGDVCGTVFAGIFTILSVGLRETWLATVAIDSEMDFQLPVTACAEQRSNQAPRRAECNRLTLAPLQVLFQGRMNPPLQSSAPSVTSADECG